MYYSGTDINVSATAPVRNGDIDKLVGLKVAIWGYFVLLILEGALRKWFLPSLATPLLVVRDPLALYVVSVAWRQGLMPRTFYLTGMIGIGVVGIFTAVLFGHGNMAVTLFGARILLIHYPLIFAIGRVFTREDVIRIGNVLLWMVLPMAILILLQFSSPQSAWVNRGVGGALEGSGFSGAMGYFRPSATFSFTNGTSLFFGLAGAYILYFWLASREVNKFILLCSTIGLLISIPLSISRSLFFGVGLSVIFALLTISRNPKYVGKMILAVVGIAGILAVLSERPFFQTALEVFLVRFESASSVEGGLEGVLLDRYLGGMLGALSQSDSFPFFGYGMGLGTNAGSMLLKGEVLYLISEGEWGRLIGEMGPFLGLSAIFIRLAFSMRLSLACYGKLAKGDSLPWLLVSFGLIVLPQGQWGQPTTLGFSTLIGGLILASLRVQKEDVAKSLETINQAHP